MNVNCLCSSTYKYFVLLVLTYFHANGKVDKGNEMKGFDALRNLE